MEQPLQSIEQALFTDIQALIESSRQRTLVAANSEMTLLYWQIGKHIRQFLIIYNRAEYGKQIIATLSQQLILEYGKGYSPGNLASMVKLFDYSSVENILPTVSAKFA